MTGQERKRLIEKLNMVLHTRHRSEPYCLTIPADFLDYITYVASAFLDYSHYRGTITDTLESLLITIHGSDPGTSHLLGSGAAEDREDIPAVNAVRELTRLEMAMGPVVDRAAGNLKAALFLLLQSSQEVQNHVMGDTFQIDPDQTEDIIDYAVEHAAHLPNVHTMERNRDVFLEHFAACLSGLPLSPKEPERRQNLRLGFAPKERYEMQNQDDLHKLLVVSCGQYLNYQEYWLEIENAFEQYDETLEHADPATWFSVSQNVMEDLDTEDAIEAFGGAESALSELAANAEKALVDLLAHIFGLDRHVQKMLTGFDYVMPDGFEKRLQPVLDTAIELGADLDFPRQTAKLLAILQNQLLG